jgi:hypothetical protein
VFVDREGNALRRRDRSLGVDADRQPLTAKLREADFRDNRTTRTMTQGPCIVCVEDSTEYSTIRRESIRITVRLAQRRRRMHHRENDSGDRFESAIGVGEDEAVEQVLVDVGELGEEPACGMSTDRDDNTWADFVQVRAQEGFVAGDLRGGRGLGREGPHEIRDIADIAIDACIAMEVRPQFVASRANEILPGFIFFDAGALATDEGETVIARRAARGDDTGHLVPALARLDIYFPPLDPTSTRHVALFQFFSYPARRFVQRRRRGHWRRPFVYVRTEIVQRHPNANEGVAARWGFADAH